MLLVTINQEKEPIVCHESREIYQLLKTGNKVYIFGTTSLTKSGEEITIEKINELRETKWEGFYSNMIGQILAEDECRCLAIKHQVNVSHKSMRKFDPESKKSIKIIVFFDKNGVKREIEGNALSIKKELKIDEKMNQLQDALGILSSNEERDFRYVRGILISEHASLIKSKWEEN